MLFPVKSDLTCAILRPGSHRILESRKISLNFWTFQYLPELADRLASLLKVVPTSKNNILNPVFLIPTTSCAAFIPNTPAQPSSLIAYLILQPFETLRMITIRVELFS